MQQHTVSKAMVGGLLGTLAQMILVYGIAPLMTGRSIGLEAMLGPSCAPGMLMHILSGSVLFPLGYVYLTSQGFPASPMLKGMLWGGILWSITEGVMAPMLGAGIFSAELGGLSAALRALLGYLAYGATLGSFVGAAVPEVRYAYARYAPVRARRLE